MTSTDTIAAHRGPARPYADAVAAIREVVTALGDNPLGGFRDRLRSTANRLERIVTLEQRIDAARAALAAVPEWGDLTRGQVLDVIDRLDGGAEALDAGRAIDPDLDLASFPNRSACVAAVADAGRAAGCPA